MTHTHTQDTRFTKYDIKLYGFFSIFSTTSQDQ